MRSSGSTGARLWIRTGQMTSVFRLLTVAVLISAFLLGDSMNAGAESRAVAPCHADVRTGVLPTWARAGFSGPKPRIPHTLGRNGELVAVLFGYPLHAPPLPNRNNKILWVSRRPGSGTALWISAQRMKGARIVGDPISRIVRGGPGPSLVNLPAPGCWRLTLSWWGRRDSLDLKYHPSSNG